MQNQKLSVVEKIGYGAGDMAVNVVISSMMLIITFFYTDIYGLKTSDLALLFLVVKFVGAIADLVALDADLQWARGEAVKRNAPIGINFTAGLPWSYTLSEAGGTTIKTTQGSAFHNTTMNVPVFGGGAALSLQPNRGAITNKKTPPQTATPTP